MGQVIRFPVERVRPVRTANVYTVTATSAIAPFLAVMQLWSITVSAALGLWSSGGGAADTRAIPAGRDTREPVIPYTRR